jgi:hypothetical protein
MLGANLQAGRLRYQWGARGRAVASEEVGSRGIVTYAAGSAGSMHAVMLRARADAAL